MQHLAAVYEAIEDDDALARLADSVARASGCRSAHVHHFTPGGERHLLQVSRFTPDQLQLYGDHFVDKDPWLRSAQVEGPTGRVLNMDRLVPPEAFMRTEIYNDLFRAGGDDTGRCMGALSRLGTGLLVTAVHRPLGGTPFTLAEEARLDEVLSHVRRALRARQVIEEERAQVRRLNGMVEATETAILVVDKRMRILCGSTAALRVLDARDGLSARGPFLAASAPALADALRRAVAATIDRLPPKRSGFLCERLSGRAGYRLLVLPAGAAGDQGAIVLIDDPTAAEGARGTVAWMAQAYGLTPAEQALATGLLAGMTLAEIADRRGVTRETLRTQLKSLFAKTDTSRQVDLIRLLGPAARHSC